MRSAAQLDSRLTSGRDMRNPEKTNDSINYNTGGALIEPQRFDRVFVDCSCDLQAVIALEIRDSRPRVDAQRTGDWTIIVACVLQRRLNVRDYFIGEQITVGVDRSIVIVIGLQRIVTVGWIPVAPIQEVISGIYEDDGLTMIVPPVTIMPLVPVTPERIVKAGPVLFVVPFFAVAVFRPVGLLLLRSGLWIAVFDMPLRIYRRQSVIVGPERAPFTNSLQRAQFSVVRRCIGGVR